MYYSWSPSFCPHGVCSRGPHVMKLTDVTSRLPLDKTREVRGRHLWSCCELQLVCSEEFQHPQETSPWVFMDHGAHSSPTPCPLPSSKAGAQQDKEGHLEVFQGKVSLPRSLPPGHSEVDRGRCAQRTVSFPHAHFPIFSKHHQSLNSLGSVDPLKGQSPRPLETSPVLRLAFMLYLVGEERCQGKDWDLVHNRAHSGVGSLTVVLKYKMLPGFGVPTGLHVLPTTNVT